MGAGMDGDWRQKGLTVVIGISTEKIAEDISVAGCVASPHFPDFVTQRVGDELVFRTFHDVIRADVGRLGVGVIGCVEFLGGKKSEVFAPEEAAERGGVVAGFERVAVHCTVDEVSVFHYNGKFAVVDTHL